MKPRPVFPILLAFALLAGCAPRETDVEAGIRTKTLLVGNGGEPTSLDPHLANMLYDQCVLNALFEGLTAIDETTSQPVPAAAERWEVSPDGLVYTFHLRANVRWSNGDPVTARDFVFSVHRILSPRLAAPYGYMLWPIKNAKAFNDGQLTDFAAVGIEAIDDTTLRLTLEHPTPYLPALAAHSTWLPVHRGTVEKFGAVDDRMNPWPRPGRLVGNGPYTLTDWRPDIHVVVTKNPLYWDVARNRLERIVFFPPESTDVEERNFRAGQFHVTFGLSSARIAHYREQDPRVLRLEPMMGDWFLRFNVKKPPLDNARVRRALSLAIDRRLIAERATANSREPAACLTPPNCAGYTARSHVPTDFAAARRLMAEAGFPEGRGLPAFEIQTFAFGDLQKASEVIQETWRRELGVNVTIAGKEGKVFLQNEQTLDFAISLHGWAADFADPATFLELFVTNGGQNWTGWGHPEYDRLISEASRTLDPVRRFEIFQQAEALLLDEAPIAPVFFDAQTYLLHPAVKGWVPSALHVRRYQRVWLEP